MQRFWATRAPHVEGDLNSYASLSGWVTFPLLEDSATSPNSLICLGAVEGKLVVSGRILQISRCSEPLEANILAIVRSYRQARAFPICFRLVIQSS